MKPFAKTLIGNRDLCPSQASLGQAFLIPCLQDDIYKDHEWHEDTAAVDAFQMHCRFWNLHLSTPTVSFANFPSQVVLVSMWQTSTQKPIDTVMEGMPKVE